VNLNAEARFRGNHTHLLTPRKFVPTFREAILVITPYYLNTVIPHLQQQCTLIKKPPPSTLHLSTLNLPSDFTKPIIKQLMHWDTHHEWMSDTKYLTGAPLRHMDCLPIPLKPYFLYHEDLPLATLRVKLRADRVNTQQRLHLLEAFLRKKTSPVCPFPACNPNPQPLLPVLDSVPHMLLECHRHDTERAALIVALATVHYTLPLTVAFLTGTTSLSTHPNINHTKKLLAITGTFLQSIVSLRNLDPLLTPLLNDNPG
jgi:hypothetical protein